MFQSMLESPLRSNIPCLLPDDRLWVRHRCRNFFEDRAAWTCFSTSPGFGMKKRFTAERPLSRQIRKIEAVLTKS